LAVCLEILAEYREVALRLSRRYEGIDISPLLDLIAVHAHLVQAAALPAPICADPKDDIFVACALAARTRIILSGDKHLLAVSGYAGLQVLRPKLFVEQFL
jgi:predicted nucleic acid-binding protein